MKRTISEQLDILKRGTIEIFTVEQLSEKLEQSERRGKRLRIKLGLDPTSPDIHLGHTVVLRKMRQFQDFGHVAVLIIGDYTARIGDPTGQNATRPMLSDRQIEKNAQTYFEQAGKILETSKGKLEVRYNSEWLEKMTLMELIQLAAKKTVTQMLQRDSFKLRLQKDIDVYTHEFIYPLMQGYDSVMIESDVELGGTDQTFNNLVGRDIQKAYNQPQQVVVTMPILVGLDGTEKMSKSKGNYIGVTDSADEMFGKIMSIPDAMMENYFTLLTDTPAEEIEKLTNPGKTHPKEAKVILSKNIVAQFHDSGSASAAEERFEKVFAKKQLPDEIPTHRIDGEKTTISKLMLSSKMASSGGEAKRLVKQSAVSINGKKVHDPHEQIEPEDGMIVQVGKRKFIRLEVMGGKS